MKSRGARVVGRTVLIEDVVKVAPPSRDTRNWMVFSPARTATWMVPSLFTAREKMGLGFPR
ncbi:MAG: hypothetical protein BWY88_01231 [Synergistetes bacterium ADurb.Bin520]|nr:MAG: hypothetical protein BWY88_01231 [Synergistetes bacterium ADurb.Bin520]